MTHNHNLVLVWAPAAGGTAYEVCSLQAGVPYTVLGAALDPARIAGRAEQGLPFGTQFRSDFSLIHQPDWSEEIAAGLENVSVIGRGAP